ncbi:hypothetical protein [Sulfurospirillum cavolei]|uniref:hypothetical protein n=1 Tax=Sulfurospirillum cavolei TaxID=366522 RepID=UPI0005A7A56E|nr:hypothetical protein [Sulfurospirillum cavolei]
MDDESITRTIESLMTNEELNVQVTRKRKASTPPYSTIGNGRTTKEYKDAPVVDAFRVIGQLSPQQLEIFLYFRDVIVENALYHRNTKTRNDQPNHVTLSRSSENHAEKQIKTLLGQNNNSARLQKMNIIKKIRVGVYMVNPYLLIPSDNFAEVAKQWNEL